LTLRAKRRAGAGALTAELGRVEIAREHELVVACGVVNHPAEEILSADLMSAGVDGWIATRLNVLEGRFQGPLAQRLTAPASIMALRFSLFVANGSTLRYWTSS